MNAAVTIFSLGIGVGIILGDSFREHETTYRTVQTTHDENGNRQRDHHNDSSPATFRPHVDALTAATAASWQTSESAHLLPAQ
jgi:hypothetical protein